jgi:DNA polymerase-1
MNKRPPRNGEKKEFEQNTLLVDGNALFKTGYFGAKNQYNHAGVHVGGLYSFLTILRKLLTEELYHRVYVFWDGNFSGKLRYEFYEDYKIGRGKDYINGTQPTDDSELSQRRMVWDYLNGLNIRQLKDEVIESDDFIAYYCLNKADNEKITICSSDRDFNQLISEKIRIYFLDLKVYVDNTNFSSYFCYKQENSALIKIMTGDSSDSIKGIKGLQEKTLFNLFPEFKDRKVTLEEIINSAKKQQEQRLIEKKKPLKILDNIINSITDGVQKERIYEINYKLVDLTKPLMNEKGINGLEELIEGFFDIDYDSKDVFDMMKRDGLDKILGDFRYPDFLIPFKKLIEREKRIING